MSQKNKKLSIAAGFLEKEINDILRKVSLSDIEPSASQPRLDKDINIQQLAESIQKDGLLQPILITKSNKSNKYKIIAGERRFRAAKLLNWKTIDCRILNRNDDDTYRLAVIENLQRENLNPYEEAKAFLSLKQIFRYSIEELSKVVGKSRSYINEILSIASISDSTRVKAEKVGIKNTNLLIQLAQAEKNKNSEEFIKTYIEGKIKTVQSAKEFNKNNKQQISNKNQNTSYNRQKIKNNTHTGVHIEWHDNKSGKIEIGIQIPYNTNIDKNKLKEDIKQTVQKYFQKYSLKK